MSNANTNIEKLFDDFENFRSICSRNLMKILADNSCTDYGKDMGFALISSEKEYTEKVPVTTFGDYLPYLDSGRSITAYNIVNMLVTSGTMGIQKAFPITSEALDRYSFCMHDMMYFLMGGKEGPHFLTSVFKPPVNGKSILSSAYYHYYAKKGIFDSEAYAGGKELLFTDKTENITYVKAWTALSCPDLVSVQSMFIYEILILMSYIENNHARLISDMRSGTFSEKLDGSVRDKLLSMRPSEERLNELEEIFDGGFDKPTVRRIWKKIRFISGVGGKIFEVQEKALKKYTGDIPFFYFVYASSEGFSGMPVEMDKFQYALMPENGYYEFMSVGDGSVYPVSEISAGETYELVITTFSGLYRYATGDLVTVDYFKGETPVVRITGRRNHILDIAGEKLDEATARSAVERLSAELGVKFSDFSLGIDTNSAPEKYILFAETGSVPDNAAELLDRQLCALSPDYRELRELMSIGMPEIVRMDIGEIGLKLSEDIAGSVHSKPHVFLDASRMSALLSGTKDGI